MPRKVNGSTQRPCAGGCGRPISENERLCGDPECSQKFFFLLTKMEARLKARIKEEQKKAKKKRPHRARPSMGTMGELVAFKEPKPDIA